MYHMVDNLIDVSPASSKKSDVQSKKSKNNMPQ